MINQSLLDPFEERELLVIGDDNRTEVKPIESIRHEYTAPQVLLEDQNLLEVKSIYLPQQLSELISYLPSERFTPNQEAVQAFTWAVGVTRLRFLERLLRNDWKSDLKLDQHEVERSLKQLGKISDSIHGLSRVSIGLDGKTYSLKDPAIIMHFKKYIIGGQYEDELNLHKETLDNRLSIDPFGKGLNVKKKSFKNDESEFEFVTIKELFGFFRNHFTDLSSNKIHMLVAAVLILAEVVEPGRFLLTDSTVTSNFWDDLNYMKMAHYIEQVS